MKKNKTYIGLILLAAGLLAGCSGSEGESDEVTPALTSETKTAEISVKTNLSRMLTKTGPAIVNSNGDLQSNALKIEAYFNNTNTRYLDSKLVYDTDHWRFDNGLDAESHYYWPIDGSVYDPSSANITVSSLDFVGYCPYGSEPGYITTTPTYNHSTGVSFPCNMSSYMTNAAQEGVKEYLIAVLKDQTYADQVEHSGVPLQFKHPFALIKFTITAASGTHVQINSIKLTGLKTAGTCTYNGTTMAWSDLTGSADMTLTQTLKNGGTTEGTPFMVIPNNYGSKYLTVNATWDDWSPEVTLTDYGTDVDFDWQPGYIYTYNLTLDKYALKVDIDEFTEQW